MTETNQPVPVPLNRRWREFRIRYLPIVVFVAVAGVVALLWQDHVTPTQAVGLAMADQYELRSPREGIVRTLSKARFDLVAADEVVLALHPAHAEQLQAQLEVIRAEILMIRTGLEPVIGQQRNQLNYEQLRIDMMNARIQLAADRLERDRLQREVERNQQLFDQNLLSAAEYDRLVTEVESFNLRIREGEELLTELADRLSRIAALWSDEDPYGTSVQAAITVKEKELEVLEAELSPAPLTAPAGGIVSDVLRRNGEYVVAGEPLMQIRSETVGFVVGYIRQPLTRIPENGANVQIHSKSRNEIYEGVIAQVGFQLEPIHEALLRPGLTVEYALPIRVHVAPDTPILPGEIVDIRL